MEIDGYTIAISVLALLLLLAHYTLSQSTPALDVELTGGTRCLVHATGVWGCHRLLMLAVTPEEQPLANGEARKGPKQMHCTDPATGGLLGTVPCMTAAQVQPGLVRSERAAELDLRQ